MSGVRIICMLQYATVLGRLNAIPTRNAKLKESVLTIIIRLRHICRIHNRKFCHSQKIITMVIR